MTANRYFYNTFTNADVAPIPVDTQPSGVLNYEDGYGEDYEKNLLTDPDAKPIGRLTMNQLFQDITTQLQQYSQYGTPDFITTLQNEGVPFEYPIYARVRYLDEIYENQVADNTALPGTDNSWLLISGDATGIVTGVMLDFAGLTVPAGYLPCDDQAVSRVTYAALFNAITQVQSGVTTNTTASVTGLTSTAQMYVGMELESANFPAGTAILSVDSSTSITADANATASGTVDIRFFNWGAGDGSTTFNVPDFRRNVAVGQGGSGTAVLANAVGAEGGEEAHLMTTDELVAHSHPIPYQGQNANATGGVGPWFNAGTGSTDSTSNNTTAGNAFNIMQKSAVVYKIIKT